MEEGKILFLSLIAAPEGIHKICSNFPAVKVLTSEIDEGIAGFQVVPGAALTPAYPTCSALPVSSGFLTKSVVLCHLLPLGGCAASPSASPSAQDPSADLPPYCISIIGLLQFQTLQCVLDLLLPCSVCLMYVISHRHRTVHCFHKRRVPAGVGEFGDRYFCD